MPGTKKFGSLFYMKQFRLLAFLFLFILVVTCFSNVYFYNIQAREKETARQARLANMAASYTDTYSELALLLRNLADNSLVDELEYGIPYNSEFTRKNQSLINTLSLLVVSQSRSVQPYVYFFHTDSVVTDRGKMEKSLFSLATADGRTLSADEMAGERTRDIHIVPFVRVYSNSPYIDREQVDWGTLYVYTISGVSVMMLKHNAPVHFSLSAAAQSGDTFYAVWDNAEEQLLFSSDAAELSSPCADAEAYLTACADARAGMRFYTRESGRFTFVLGETERTGDLFSMRINVFLWITVTIGVFFMIAFYLVMRKEVFRPVSAILDKLCLHNHPHDEYNAIAEEIGSMQNRISDLQQSLKNQSAQERLSRMRLSLLGEEVLTHPEESAAAFFAVVTLVSETKACAREACAWLEDQFAARPIAHVNENRVYLVWFEAAADYEAFAGALSRLPAPEDDARRLALGVSAMESDPARIREAYLASSEILHARPDGNAQAPLVSIGGQSASDHSIRVPLDANASGMLLSLIAQGDAEAAEQFVSDILDADLPFTIEQNRYRAAYLLDVLGMAQNARREPVFDLALLITRVRTLVSPASMQNLVLDACRQLTLAFAGSDNDQLIRFILGYVEEHYAENIYLKTIAEEARLSYAYISHYFSERQGIGFADYLNSFRIEKACRLLTGTRLTLNEIAQQVGFGSMNTFSRNMKKFMGVTPDVYRKTHAGR